MHLAHFLLAAFAVSLFASSGSGEAENCYHIVNADLADQLSSAEEIMDVWKLNSTFNM